MANKNPIKKADPGNSPDYEIPAIYKDSKLYLSITTSLAEKDGWKLGVIHSVLLRGWNINPSRTEDPKRLVIGENETCADLSGAKFRVISQITRIRDGGGETLPDIKYTVHFEVKEGNKFVTVDSFDATWDNPSNAKFYTRITIKV